MDVKSWTHGTVHVDGVRLHYAEAGEGPLVVLVHGFPESWYSWRHQLRGLSKAGFRAVAIDVRGYGRSSSPTDVDEYSMVRYVADNVALVQALGAERAAIVGHDWGAPIAANSALLRPDIFGAVAMLSVPYHPWGGRSPLSFARALGGDQQFYWEYFQEPGIAEAEIEADVRGWLLGFYFSGSGEAPFPAPGEAIVTIPAGERMRDRFVVPDSLPGWLSAADLDFYTAEFERTGFTGALNRYRNLERDWVQLAALADQPIRIPALFIGGALDGPTLWGGDDIARFPETLPLLHGSHVLPACGHWVQQEQPDAVTELLVEFLAAQGDGLL